MATVLIVDDQDDIRESLRTLLEDAGHTVLEANNGQLGVEMASSHSPDVTLMDVMMPVMNGIDALRQIRESPTTGKMPVVMVTAYGQGEHLRQAAEYGAKNIIHKPWESGEIELVLDWALKSRGQAEVSVR